MKTTIRIISLLLVLCTLAGCSNKGYKIYKKGDNYYITIDQDEDDPSENECRFEASIVFQSLDEMRSDIRTGNFNEKEWEELHYFYKNEAREIEVYNIDKLLIPVGTDNLGPCNIRWYGDNYDFEFTESELAKKISVKISSKEDYNYIKQQHLTPYSGAVEIEYPDPDVNSALKYAYTAPGLEGQYLIFYTTEIDEKKLYVCEESRIGGGINFKACVETQDYFYYISVGNAPNRISAKFLASFAIEQYKG